MDNVGSETTNSEGLATFEDVQRGDYEYTVKKDDYDLEERELYLDSDLTDEVTLYRQNIITNTDRKMTYEKLREALDETEEAETLILGSGEYEEVNGEDYYLGLGVEDITLKAAREHEAKLLGMLPGTQVEGITIKDLAIDADGLRHGIDIHNDNTTVENNIIKNADLGIYIGPGEEPPGPDEDIEIVDNVIEENEEVGINIHGESTVDTISDNVIIGHQGAGLVVQDGSEATINNNEVLDNGYVGVEIANNSQADIEDNLIQDHDYWGININYDSTADITENHIKESEITDDTGVGIILDTNYEEENGEWVPVEDTGSEAIIKDNVIEGLNQGIKLRDSTAETITGNELIENRDTGIYSVGTELNVIADNLFIGGEETAAAEIIMDFSEYELEFVDNAIENMQAGIIFEDGEIIPGEALQIEGNNIDVQEFDIEGLELIEPEGELLNAHVLFLPGIDKDLGDMIAGSDFAPEAEGYEEVVLEGGDEELIVDMLGVIE